jgi:hypothetical protein
MQKCNKNEKMRLEQVLKIPPKMCKKKSESDFKSALPYTLEP